MIRPSPLHRTLADLLADLGDIPAVRVRLTPLPGKARMKDLVLANATGPALYELIDDVLVEKGIGFFESRLAAVLIYLLEEHLTTHDLGIVVSPDAPFRLSAGTIRLPDVSFISWERLPQGELPKKPVADLAPDLAVEILSASNTTGEMLRKRRELFAAGVRLVWEIDAQARSARVYTAPQRSTLIEPDGSLDGGRVLPGFRVGLAELFARAERRRKKR